MVMVFVFYFFKTKAVWAIMENDKDKTLLLEEEIASLKLKLGLVAEIKGKS
jgi:hypothetical protein